MDVHGLIIRSAERVDGRHITEAKRHIKAGTFLDPFIIIGHIPAISQEFGVTTWRLVISPAQSDLTGEISANEAKRIIERYAMDVTARDNTARIYEAPGRPFQAKWRHYYETQQFLCFWDRIYFGRSADRELAKSPYIYAERTASGLLVHLPEGLRERVSEAYRAGMGWTRPLRNYAGKLPLSFTSIETSTDKFVKV